MPEKTKRIEGFARNQAVVDRRLVVVGARFRTCRCLRSPGPQFPKRATRQLGALCFLGSFALHTLAVNRRERWCAVTTGARTQRKPLAPQRTARGKAEITALGGPLGHSRVGVMLWKQ